GVVWPHRVAHPLLVPGRLVHTVVVAAAPGNRHLVELRVEQQRAGRVLPTGRAAGDADAADVVVWVLSCDGRVPEDAVGEARVTEVVPAHVVERLGAALRPHAVHLHDDETEPGEVDEAGGGAERVPLREIALRSGINLFDDRVLLVRVKVARPGDVAPDVG